MPKTKTERLNLAIDRAMERTGCKVLEELAEKIGVSRVALHKWRTGETTELKDVNLVTLGRLSGLRVEWITFGDGDMETVGIAEPRAPYSSLEMKIIDHVRALPEFQQRETLEHIQKTELRNQEIIKSAGTRK